ncbi:MAG: malate dehydrogenase [Geitlerinemataceae cyanobacterium]
MTIVTPNRQPRVSVIGAGRVGSTLAQRVLERDLADVVLLDTLDGWPQGVALDLNQARALEGHSRTAIGTNDYADTAGSDIVVITAGKPRLPGMDRADLIQTNAAIVTGAAKAAIAQSPDAIVIVVTNPLDVMTYLAWKATGLPSSRVMGMAGVLDAARLKTFIAEKLGADVRDVQTSILGNHGQQMIPIARYCTVSGIPLPELLDEATIETLFERARNGGAELVNLMKTGSAFYAPASSVYKMVAAILQDAPRLVTAAAYLDGEYGIKDVFLGAPCRLGRGGVMQVREVALSDRERKALDAAAAAVRQNIDTALAIVGA